MDAVQKCVWIAAILLVSARPAVHGVEQTNANSSSSLDVANYSMPAAAGHDRPVDTGIVEGEADERRRQTSWHLNRQFDHFFTVTTTTTTTSRPVKKLPTDDEAATSTDLDIASSDGAAGVVINGLRNNKLPVIRPFFLDPEFLGSKTSNNPAPSSSKTDDVVVMAEGNSRGRQGVQRSFANFPTLLNQPDKHDDGYADSIDRRTIWPPPPTASSGMSGMLSGIMIVTPSSKNVPKTVSSIATSKEKTTTIFAESAKVRPKEEEEKGPPMVLTTKFNDTTIGTAFDLSEDHTDADQLMLSMKVLDGRQPSTSTLRNVVKVTPSSIINVISGQQHGVSTLWNAANSHHKPDTATTVNIQDQPTTLDPGLADVTVDNNATVMSRAETMTSTPTPVMTSHTPPPTTLGPPADLSVDKNNFNYTTTSSVVASQPLTTPGGLTSSQRPSVTSSSASTSRPPSMTTSAKMDITVKAVFMNSTSEELHLMTSSTTAALETEATKVPMTSSTARTRAASAEVFMAPSTASVYVVPANDTEESRSNETTSKTWTSTVSSALNDVTFATRVASKFTSTSSALPEVSSTSTTISASTSSTSMSRALPEITSRTMLTSSSSALLEVTSTTTTTATSTEPKRRVNFLANPRKAFRSRPSTPSTPSTVSAWTEFPLTSSTSTRSSVTNPAGLITRSTVEPKYVPTMPPPIPTSTRRQHVITVPAIDDAGFVIVAEDEDYDEESSALRPTSQLDDAEEDGLIPEGANEAIMVSSAIGGCAVVFFAVIMIFCMLRNRRTVYRAPTESTSASGSSSASSASPFHTMKLPMKV